MNDLLALAVALSGDHVDATEIQQGAQAIPSQVTLARRRGELVTHALEGQHDVWRDAAGRVIGRSPRNTAN